MKTLQRSATGREVPRFVWHESFETLGAEAAYAGPLAGLAEAQATHLTDDLTRECARRMHYAAYRMSQARGRRTQRRWERAYYSWRDAVIVGNRKLIYRVVRRHSPSPRLTEELSGDCHIVLVRAVALFNPWLSIRFSTYAYTCLARAVFRLGRKYLTGERLMSTLDIDQVLDDVNEASLEAEPPRAELARVARFFQEDDHLLSPREKTILTLRFLAGDEAATHTLADVGAELGISKERVRQLQFQALAKLRQALGDLGDLDKPAAPGGAR